MSKILVTPVHKEKLYIDFDTNVEFPSGKVVETKETPFVKAKIRMGELRLATEEEIKEFEANRPADNSLDDKIDNTDQSVSELTIEQFKELSADEQKQKLIDLGKAKDLKDEAISNETKRETLYAEFLDGAGA